MFKIRKRYIYGHGKSEKQITKHYPYCNLQINKRDIPANSRVTYDIFLAYEWLRKGEQFLYWGAIYNGKKIFVATQTHFKHNNILPFE